MGVLTAIENESNPTPFPMVDAGLIVLVSFISPYRAERGFARSLFRPGEFVEVFIDTPLEMCEQRDPKGLYAKARAGELKNFTGVDSAYETSQRKLTQCLFRGLSECRDFRPLDKMGDPVACVVLEYYLDLESARPRERRDPAVRPGTAVATRTLAYLKNVKVIKLLDN